MRTHAAWIAGLAAVAAPVAALAMMTDKPKVESGSSPTIEARAPATPRQEAERWYGDAYGDVAKAKQELAAGKDRNAEKRFRRAMERAEKAVALDSTYHEALNLLGYSARHLKLWDRSLAAYRRCLAIEPDYAAAREYLGELHVDRGEIDLAREQLAWLESREQTEAATTLRARIEAHAAARPDSGAAATPASGAR